MNRQQLCEWNRLALTCHRDGRPFPHLPDDGNLDGALKKNSAMANKLRGASEGNWSRLCEELKRLRFSKFIAEFTVALLDAALKIKPSATDGDVRAIVEIASLLHQRSPDFLTAFLDGLLRAALDHNASPLLKALEAPDAKAEQQKLGQIRASLRILGELNLVGCAPPDLVLSSEALASVSSAKEVRAILAQAGGIIAYLLRLYLHGDKETHQYAPVLVSFAKAFHSTAFFRETAEEEAPAAEMASMSLDDIAPSPTSLAAEPTVSVKVRQWLATLTGDYYQSLVDRLTKECKALAKMMTYNRDYEITRGELTDLQKTRVEVANKSRDQVLGYVQALSGPLGKEAPDLKELLKLEEDLDTSVSATVVAIKADGERDWTQAPFEDDETERFYSDLVKLDNFIPASYFVAESKKTHTAGKTVAAKPVRGPKGNLYDDDEGTMDAEWMAEVDEEVMKMVDADVIAAETEEQSQADNAPAAPIKSVAVHLSGNLAVDVVLSRLPDLISSTLIDEAVVDFCNAQFQCKALARMKLIQTLVDVPRFRMDLLPYYARFIATLHPHLPDIGATVLSALHSQFRRLFRKQHRFDTENRVKNVRYIGELAKFRVCPTHIVFYCFKRLVQPETSGSVFNSQHVEVACGLLESCGRFMLKTPETCTKFANLVEMLKKKAKVLNLDSRVFAMVQNALYVINPPPLSKRKQAKLRTPLEHFLRKLIFVDLCPRNVESILDHLRVLPWGQKIALPAYRPEITSEDPMAENELVLDVNDFMRKLFVRIWKIKFIHIELMADMLSGLAVKHEAFVVSVVDDVLESIRVGLEEHLDHRYHQRRVLTVKYLGELYNYRLVSTKTIFDTLYSFIFLGHNGRPMPPSEQPPSEIDMPVDFFRIRLICTLLETCGKYFRKGQARTRLDHFLAYFQYYILTKTQDAMPLEVGFMIEDTWERLGQRQARLKDVTEAANSLQKLEESMGVTVWMEEDEEDLRDNAASDEEEFDGEWEAARKEKMHEERRKAMLAEEEAFDREMARLLEEGLQDRKLEKRTALDVAVPLLAAKPSRPSISADEMEFQVLTKGKSNRKVIAIPISSRIVTSTLSNQEMQQAERQRMKKLVLETLEN